MATTRQLRDRLAEQATQGFVGREAELQALLAILEDDGPAVTHLHGIGGIGKSSLLATFVAVARRRGAAVVLLDCRTMEPTERGFLDELAMAIGGGAAGMEEVAVRLGALGERVVLALDAFEVFRLLDTWLRRVYVPALAEHVRVLVAGREPPVAAWTTAPEWRGLFQSLPLGPLDERAALALLRRDGVAEADARRILRFTHGHPLALTLAATAAAERPDLDLPGAAIGRVVEELTRLYLADVPDPLTRRVLEAASVVRRATRSTLGAMLPDAAPQDAYERLRSLPFVMAGGDGLVIHETVQGAIAAALRAGDPSAHRAYRRAAWGQLRAEVRGAGRAELWRYTADLLYLIDNPVVREAFFPSDAYRLAIETARPEDEAAIRALVAQHEGPEAGRWLLAWWEQVPGAFFVARDHDGSVAGFYTMCEPEAVDPALLAADPIARGWRDHLSCHAVPRGQHVLLCRRWLSRDVGELPSPAQAACWLDIKRTYMALRPHLQRVYMPVRELATYGPVAQQLGFRVLPEAGVTLDGAVYHAAMLDFGPMSVDGWLSTLAGMELGVADERLLDAEARELVLNGRRVPLTRLEFGVFDYLARREGKAVSRADLLADVWGYSYEGGSNVVDVAVRALRKKLGERAGMIETVTGIGYRLRP